jgi:hypothetical protein
MVHLASSLTRWLLAIVLLGGIWLISQKNPVRSAVAIGKPALLLHPPGNPAQDPPVDTHYAGLDFSDPSQMVKIKIFPPKKRINGGNPIVIKFYPGQECGFGERRACIHAYRAPGGQNVIFITVHSGVRAEAEVFRQAVEGNGFNQAGLSLEKTLARLGDLEGAPVIIVQGDTSVEGLQLSSLGRIPAQGVSEYFASPVARSLEVAAGYDESLAWAVDPGQPIIVFETCGWRMRGEPGSKSLAISSASVYLGVIAAGEP